VLFAIFASGKNTIDSDVIKGEYVVLLSSGVDHASVVEQSSLAEAQIFQTYSIGQNFHGFAIKKLFGDEFDSLASHPAIVGIYPNTIFQLYKNDTCQEGAGRPWGLGRTIIRRAPQGGAQPGAPYQFRSDGCGDGIDVYVLDSGMRISHRDFEGRASLAANFVDEPDVDYVGHGTHVASTIAGKEFGIAKCANLFSVKVCDYYGRCALSGIIAGIDFVAKAQNKKKVGNMSLGGATNRALNAALDASVLAGVMMVVAAGNEGSDACGISPASAELAFTVGSTNERDQRSDFSNSGRCLSIFAPGENILGAGASSDSAIDYQSGTSMASPHVAGVAAKLWSMQPDLTIAQLKRLMLQLSTPDVVSRPGTGSPNTFLFADCGQVRARE
jgi:hypothetical protein